jgi:hypothetical protein
MTHTFERCGANFRLKSNGVPSLQRALAQRASRIAGSTVSHCVGSIRAHAETSQPAQSARHAAVPSFQLPPSSAHLVGLPGSHRSPSSTLPSPQLGVEASLAASGGGVAGAPAAAAPRTKSFLRCPPARYFRWCRPRSDRAHRSRNPRIGTWSSRSWLPHDRRLAGLNGAGTEFPLPTTQEFYRNRNQQLRTPRDLHWIYRPAP